MSVPHPRGTFTAFHYGICIVMAIVSVSPARETVLDSIINKLPPSCRTVVADSGRYNLQIIYSQIDRDQYNRPGFVHYTFNVDPYRYFYPGSLVKLPAAALALKKIASLKLPRLTRKTLMAVENSCGCPVAYDTDDGDQKGVSSIESSIKRMLLVSDNGGFNRLWEFLTRDYLNSQLTRYGFGGIRILHRMAPCTAEQNAVNNAVHFFSDSGGAIYSQPRSNSRVPVANPCAPLLLGFATMREGTLVPQPLHADYLNYAALEDLHHFLIGIMFPQTIDKGMQLLLAPEDYRLLRTWMCLLPEESGMPRYDSIAEYPDNYKKYLLYGTDSLPVSPTLREFNIVGKAYGFISDVAYFADFKTRVEFFLSVTMNANVDQIMNDDQYEYDSMALPLFKALTSAIYKHELSRPRKNKPDLREFEPELPSK